MAGLVNVDLGGLFGTFAEILDEAFTTEEEKAAAKLKMLELQQRVQLAQMAVNQTEAQHNSLFVAGWRPYIGWACGLALTYNFLLYPMMQFVAWALFQYNGTTFPLDTLPVLDLSLLLPILGGMLGLGALRTKEKLSGVARSNMKQTPLPATRPILEPDKGLY